MTTRHAKRRTPALLLLAAAVGALAVLWLLRPDLPRLPRSLGEPLTIGGIEHLAGFAAWCVAALLAVTAAARAIREGRRRRAIPLAAPAESRNRRRARTATRTTRLWRPQAALLVVGTKPAAETSSADVAGVLSGDQVGDKTQEPAARGVAVSLLGPFALRGAHQGRGLRSATEHLIAYLALHPDGATRDELLEALWPEQDPRRTRARLWQSVTQARKTLGDEAFVRDRYRYRIDRDRVRVDAVELDELLSDADRAEEPADQRRLVERAAALVRDRPLVDIDLPWADQAARRLNGTIVTLFQRIARARLLAGEPRLAIEAAERGLAIDELSEPLWRLAIEAEGALGLRDSVAHRYERLSEILDDRLGLEPTRETRALYRSLLVKRDHAPAGARGRRRFRSDWSKQHAFDRSRELSPSSRAATWLRTTTTTARAGRSRRRVPGFGELPVSCDRTRETCHGVKAGP
jgi:DNA-binding SARP family transcriptional activator